MNQQQEFLKDSIYETILQDRFYVKHTESEKATADYIAKLSRFLSTKDSQFTKAFSLDTWSDNQDKKSKQLSVSDIFAKQLLIMKGMTPRKVSAIISKYNTPAKLMQHASEANTLSKFLEDVRTRNGKRLPTRDKKILYDYFLLSDTSR